MPKLDVDALKKAVAKGQAAALGSPGPGGRPRTGTKGFVREHLDAILQLREDTRATWAQVVSALCTRHDLRQGNGMPITGRRLNALVCACLKERARTAAAATARARRPDLAEGNEPAVLAHRTQRETAVASATRPAVTAAAPDTRPLSEDEIRRIQRARHQHLFKKG